MFYKNLVESFFTNKQRILLLLGSNYYKPFYSEHIQEELGIKKSYASTLLTELERENKIRREIVDKRKRIFLTEYGFKLLMSCVDSVYSILHNFDHQELYGTYFTPETPEVVEH